MVMAEVQHRGHPFVKSQINQHRTGQSEFGTEVHFHQTNFDLNHPPIKKKQRVSLCVGCGGPILDQHILRVAPDLEWHAACLKCQECQQFLDESCTCFVRDGKTFCKRDYVRLFGTKCDKCGCSFSKSDFVMRAKSKIYHIECFRCSICARQLIPGDEFALRGSQDGSSLFCKEDHDVLEKSNQNSLTLESNNNTIIQNNNCSSSRKMSLSNSSNNHFSELGSVSDSESESESHKSIRGKQSGTSDGKPTRIRTVLNEKQLHTLRTCYNANPRPDALMKEQLVEMTSLSPRVIRVWFQNKRCKDKKKTIQMKLQMQQEKEGRKMGYNGLQGIPMIASSPVRHDSPLNFHGIEITSFMPPWKALSDFALHADLDNNGYSRESGGENTPAFQHLINQMHGYDTSRDMGPVSHGTSPSNKPIHPSELRHHQRSEDSYVTLDANQGYLESDESSQESP